MGFRSTFTTVDHDILWPEWFREKWAVSILFRSDFNGTLHSRCADKTYGTWRDLHADIQRAINWREFSSVFVLVFLHECGGITRCVIEENAIKWSEPESWRKSEEVEHYNCTGCNGI